MFVEGKQEGRHRVAVEYSRAHILEVDSLGLS